MTQRLLIRNLSELATSEGSSARRGGAMRELRVITAPAILVADERIEWVGPERELPHDKLVGEVLEIDGRGGTALPGFVDAHTHLPFAGLRESEFNRRIAGETYQDIAASGGGIASTVRATREATPAHLDELVLERTWRMALYGTTTAEAKSGYGLDLANEIKQLEVIARCRGEAPVDLIATALPAHEFPPGHDSSERGRREWIDEIITRILPEVARRRLAEFNDVFVEKGVFTPAEGEEILKAGVTLGLRPRIHADELTDTGGAALAARVGALSADHLMEVSPDGVRALAGSGTIANLLPGTSLFLMSRRFAPARDFIDAGAAVSLSTDCNPGSSMTESMQIVVQLACLRMGLTVEEALTAATLNSACALDRGIDRGTLEVGKRADLMIIDAPGYLHLVYHFGVNLIRTVVSGGRIVVHDGRPQTPDSGSRSRASQIAR